jgi:hypothetical protein
MAGFAEGRCALAGPLSGTSYEDWSAEQAGIAVDMASPRNADAAGQAQARLAAQALRLAELQEELHQLEHLPSLPSGAMDGGAGMMAEGLPPLSYERMLELECEIEHLREEMAGEEPLPSAPAPRAAEEIGSRILEQIESRHVADAGASERCHERELEDDADLARPGVLSY